MDCETNDLKPDIVHCIVLKDINTLEVFKFVQQECYDKFPTFFTENVSGIIGHNLLGFDAPLVLDRLLGIKVDAKDIEDTYLMSRLAYSDRWVKDLQKVGGDEEKIPYPHRVILKTKSHSLAAWGIRCGRYKPEIEVWDTYTPEILNRCSEDVEITYLTYLELQKELKHFSQYSIRLEHRVAEIIAEQSRIGMQLDIKAAQNLYEECKAKADIIEQELVKEIPPNIARLEETHIVPKVREIKIDTGRTIISEKTGRKVKEYEYIREISPQTKYYKEICLKGNIPGITPSIRGPFNPVAIVPFNPASPAQRIEVLNKAGWTPINFNKPTPKMLLKGIEVGSPLSTDEDNLKTIPDTAPQSIKKLGEFVMLTNRYKLMEQWLGLVDNTGRVHGYFDSCGTPTGRLRHANPNLANVVSTDSLYGKECRSCWIVKAGYVMVGVDAASLELRMLAHYMNDKTYTEELVNGDIHSKNQTLANLPTRANAKTFIYALLYGAGDEKIGRIVGGGKKEGRKLKRTFLENTTPLKTLIAKVTKEAETKGYLLGLDGRILWIRKPHAALNTLLQSAGAIVMKQALVTAKKQILEEKLDCKFINNIHDEILCEVHPDHAQRVGEIIVKAIENAGLLFSMNCPLTGTAKSGKNWSEVH